VAPGAGRTVRVSGGRRRRNWSEIETHALTTADETISDAGRGGLTLGYGFGWLQLFWRPGAKIC